MIGQARATFPSPLTNKAILVTGGTGSFGHAFVARALAAGAKRIAVLSRDELKQSEMARRFSDPRMRFLIGSVTDTERVARAVRGADLVVHAAALKQIGTCAQNPHEALEVNTNGSWVVAAASIKAGVEKAVMLSTDKAAAPNTLYGATKLAAERLWTQANVYAAGTHTRLVATRYGNVIGSRGSVVPVFEAQANAGGPLTITDRRMTRFWMTIEQAVALVELAFSEGRGGEVFVPKVPSADILTLAEAVAPGVPWTETGIRREEKLHETLIGEDEARDTYDHGDHYRIEPERTWETLPELDVPRVPDGFAYRSDTNPDQLDVARLRALLGEPQTEDSAA